jgi:hypothetical protein
MYKYRRLECAPSVLYAGPQAQLLLDLLGFLFSYAMLLVLQMGHNLVGLYCYLALAAYSNLLLANVIEIFACY